MPTINERRDIVMERKRLEYQNLVQQYYDTRLQEMHQETFRQASEMADCIRVASATGCASDTLTYFSFTFYAIYVRSLAVLDSLQNILSW